MRLWQGKDIQTLRIWKRCYFISFLIFVLVTRWDVNIFSHILEGFEDKASPFLPSSKGQAVFQTEKVQTLVQRQSHKSPGP